MEMTLLLNSTYEPLRVVHWQKAIALLWQGKVEVLEVYDREIHGVSISFKLPAVMRLLNRTGDRMTFEVQVLNELKKRVLVCEVEVKHRGR